MSAKVSNETKKCRILLVEDEPVTLRVQAALLKSLGFECITATNALEAQEIIQKFGASHFDCLITDYLMPPGPTGIDLLIWLRNKSSSLAAIIITAQEERSLVAESMRTGATDFLDKPVARNNLKRAVQKACEITAKQRALSANYEAVQQLAQLRGMFCSLRPIEGCAPPDVIFFPKFELGGDFVNLFPLSDGKFVLLGGDVSGHDLKAAYISSYFQGLVRGLVEQQASIQDIIRFFNGVLIREWNEPESSGGQQSFSLSALFVVVDQRNKNVHLVNCGFPESILSNGKGKMLVCDEGSQPLGWFEDAEFLEKEIHLKEVKEIILGTDGVFDFAAEQGIQPASLIYRLLHEPDLQRQKKLVEKSRDDILVIRFRIGQKQDDFFEPLLYQTLSFKEEKNIDDHQAEWERSLRYALPGEAFSDRFYDILLCCREVVLNALKHGCKGAENFHASLQISFCTERRLLRIRVEDSGKGHNFDIAEQTNQLKQLQVAHLGLVMVKALSDHLSFEKNGAIAIVDFDLNAPLKKEKK